MLIEVMISALLLGLIAAATVTGVQGINANNANQRARSEANLLAAQSQEQLRSDPIGLLEKLVREPNTYSTAVGATTYKVTQEVRQLANVSGSPKTTACTAINHTSSSPPNFRITSSVTWSDLLGGVPVKQSSIVTPPTGSTLQIDVVNAEPGTAGVSGVTAVVNYNSEVTGSPVTLEGTTSNEGCVLFTGIRADEATAELREKTGYVTPGGTLKPTPATVSIAPNLTTYHEFVFDEAGQIKAKFTYKGETEYEHKLITGNTFIATDQEMNKPPELELGSAAFAAPQSGGEELYNAETGQYTVTALTASAPKYPHGGLFPFPSHWTVYAGDCAENNPQHVVTKETVAPGSALVTPGGQIEVSVPEAYVNLKVYEGTKKAPKTPSQPFEVKITNVSCNKAPPPLPDHAASVNYAHKQNTSSNELAAPFQPFGTLEICLKAGATRHDLLTYQATTQAGPLTTVYTEELPAAEMTKLREEAEAATKTKREKEEAPAREKREKEEATEKTTKESQAATKSTRESKEASERSTWLSEEHAGHLTKAKRESDESKQTTTRQELEATEKSARETREKEEGATAKVREPEENTRAAKIKEEEAARTAKIKEETTEIAERQDTVEAVSSGKSC